MCNFCPNCGMPKMQQTPKSQQLTTGTKLVIKVFACVAVVVILIVSSVLLLSKNGDTDVTSRPVSAGVGAEMSPDVNSSDSQPVVTAEFLTDVLLDYDSFSYINDHLIIVTKDEHLGFISPDGRIVLPLEYTHASQFDVLTFRFEDFGAVLASMLEGGGWVLGYGDGDGLIPLRRNDGHWDCMDAQGSLVLSSLAVDNLEIHVDGFAKFTIDSKVGLVDIYGNVVIPAEFDYIEHPIRDSSGLRAVQRSTGESLERKAGYVDASGTVVIPLVFDVAGSFSEGLAQVRVDEKLGYIDTRGNMVLQLDSEYINFSMFIDGHAIVVTGNFPESGKIGLIDRAGRLVLPAEYEGIDGYLSVASNWGSGVTNSRYKDGVMIIRKDGKYGLVTTQGKSLVGIEYDSIMSIREPLPLLYNSFGYSFGDDAQFEHFISEMIKNSVAFCAVKDEMIFLMDVTGRTLSHIPFSSLYSFGRSFSEGWASDLRTLSGDSGDSIVFYYMHMNGDFFESYFYRCYSVYVYGFDSHDDVLQCGLGHDHTLQNTRWLRNDIVSFHEGLAARINNEGGVEFFNTKGATVFEVNYSFVDRFSDGMAFVGVIGHELEVVQFGYIDNTGTLVVPTEYSIIDGIEIAFDHEISTHRFKDGYAVVFKDERFGCINKAGEIIVSVEYDNIVRLGSDMAAVQKNGLWGIVKFVTE